MKNTKWKYILGAVSLVFSVACSTKKNTFVNRNWHALNSEYNTLFNGDVALEAGIKELKAGYKDNFWELLPVERMQVVDEAALPGQKTKNANFDRAETKATKAIQKHSMNIEGKEKNMQMDEAHLLLGKARYYDQRFIPALEAFNYILYKYANSDKIYEAKVWREKTNLRLENDALAIKNLKFLLKRNKLKSQVLADANAVLAQAFINLEEKDSAIAPMKIAVSETKLKEERARYHFILGQLYQSLQYVDSAHAEFQAVIDMKRKAPKMYVIQAHAKQAQLIDPTLDTVAFLKKYKKLFKDRENRPYLDVLNHQMALFYDKLDNKNQAIVYYNKSLRSRSEDNYLQATNYRKLATIYFDRAQYVQAGKYYDSTLTKLVKKDREYFALVKKRANLDDVIKYEGIVQKNDSILNLVALSEKDRTSFFEDYIAKLKAKEAAQKLKEQKQKDKDENNRGIEDIKTETKGGKDAPFTNMSTAPPTADNFNQDKFYFYSPTAVAYGKIEFRKKWGKRILADNWRTTSKSEVIVKPDQEEAPKDPEKPVDNAVVEEKYTPEFYTKQLPTSPVVLDSLAKERNFSNYQLGVIYKEKFLEHKLAVAKFERVLDNKPEERLILPSLYNLYKLYENTDKAKAQAVKNRILSEYPNTRYAQLLNGSISETNAVVKSPDEIYKDLYTSFRNEDYVTLLPVMDQNIAQFQGNDIVPKLELLKASVIGKLKGVDEYKKAINYVALTYSDTTEGKQADDILKVNIPRLEQMVFTQDTTSTKWKVLYKVGKKEAPETVSLMDKLKKYIQEKQYEKFSVSYDVYNETDSFVVVHGISSQEFARYFIELVRDAKDYKIKNQAQVISSDNYTVVQVKKNFNQYLDLKL